MLDHVKKFFTMRWRTCGEVIMRKVIHHGIMRANRYEITQPAPLANYIAMMIYFGSDFDEDPKIPWAAEILTDGLRNEKARGRALKLAGLAFLDNAEGIDNEHLYAALRRLHTRSLDDLIPPHQGHLKSYILDLLADLHATKCRAIGSANLERFVELGIVNASKYGLTDERGVGVYIGIMFMLGAGFDQDPQFPLLTRALHSIADKPHTSRATVLYKVARRYLETALSERQT